MTTTPWLAAVTIDPNQTPKFKYELVRKLSPKEYDAYKEADKWLSRFAQDQEKLGLLRDAYNEYKQAIDDAASQQEEMKHPISVYDVHRQNSRHYHRVNARLRGLLSEITTFLNYAEGYLKRQYGHDSEQVQRFKVRCGKEYDASPSYRFVYQLRNYALHYDVPITGMSYRDGYVHPKSGTIGKHVLIEIDRDKLLKSGFNWKKVRPDIERFPARFAVDAHLDTMLAAMGRINLEVIVAMLPDLKEGAKYIDHLIRPVVPYISGRQGTPIIVHWKSPENVAVGEEFQLTFSTDSIQANLAETILQLPEPRLLASVIDDVRKN
jgi:hypothetical protein